MTDESIVHAEQAEKEGEAKIEAELAAEVLTTEEVEVEVKKEQEAQSITTVDVDLTGANPLSVEMSADFMKAYQTLSSGRVPPEVIEKRQGPGGKIFSYVPHWWVSRQLRLALGPLWDLEVQEITLHDDGDPKTGKNRSSSCKATLTVWLPLPDGEFHASKITAIGTFVDAFGNMKTAYREASTVSRTLAKLVQLRFGIGEEFYAGEDEGIPKQEPAQAYSILKKYGTERGLTEDEIKAAFKEDDKIEFEGLAETNIFQYAYQKLGAMIKDKQNPLTKEDVEGF